MRSSLVAAACAVSLTLIGCSAAPVARAVPEFPLSSQSYAAVDAIQRDVQQPPRGLKYGGMLKWFADGKMPGPEPRWFMKKWLHDFTHRKSHHFNVTKKSAAPIALWDVSAYGYLLGLASGGHAHFGIDLYQNNC